jgi:hypothetical protein
VWPCGVTVVTVGPPVAASAGCVGEVAGGEGERAGGDQGLFPDAGVCGRGVAAPDPPASPAAASASALSAVRVLRVTAAMKGRAA